MARVRLVVDLPSRRRLTCGQHILFITTSLTTFFRRLGPRFYWIPGSVTGRRWSIEPSSRMISHHIRTNQHDCPPIFRCASFPCTPSRTRAETPLEAGGMGRMVENTSHSGLRGASVRASSRSRFYPKRPNIPLMQWRKASGCKRAQLVLRAATQ